MKIKFSRLRIVVAFIIISCFSFCTFPTSEQIVNWEEIKILLYTKNGKGFVHDNIPNSIQAIRALGDEYGFSVDTSEDPRDFSEENLKQYDAVVFSNTNNEVFETDSQKVAFMRYIQAGGGFVGIHSASGTERDWKWFKQLLGGTFYWHEPRQKFSVKIIDGNHPSLAHLPQTWERKDDECYYLTEMNFDLNILAVNDLTSLQVEGKNKMPKPTTFGSVFPSVWSQEFDGGRQWYTSLGHNKEDYLDSDFRRHILGGIKSVISDGKPLDFSKAYAQSPDDKLKN